MRTKLDWKHKYQLALSENLTIKEIMLLRDVGQPAAINIRNKAIAYCVENGIEFYTRLVPTEAVLVVTEKDLDYYYQKMVQESRLLE